jgi:BON domain
MNHRDETIREKLAERLIAVSVDARNLAITVETGRVFVSGSVPSEEQRERAIEALAGAHDIEIFVRPVATVDPGAVSTETGKAR